MEHMPDVEQVVLLLFIPPVNGELKFGEYDILNLLKICFYTIILCDDERSKCVSACFL